MGGFLLFSSVLSLIYPYIKPTPNHLPSMENWSKWYRDFHGRVPQGRKEILNDIESRLMSNDGKLKRHPLLLGTSGIGKTHVIKLLIQAIERGDYPKLAGKKIFYINTASLMSSGRFNSGNETLKKINEAMGFNRENIILVFDEIHLACHKREDNTLAELLKTLLDVGENKFPYIIGLTTEEEYYQMIYIHTAFARRFARIPIGNSEEWETLDILNNNYLQNASKTLLESGTLRYILEKTKDAVQPSTSIDVLSNCITRTSESQKSLLELKIEKMNIQLEALRAESAVDQTDGLLPSRDILDKLEDLEQTLSLLQAEFKKEKTEIVHLNQMKEILGKIKLQTYKTVLKICKIQKQQLHPSQKTLNSLLLMNYFLIPTLEQKLTEEGQRLKVRTTINKQLVDEVLKKELENKQKAEAAILRGKVQLDAKKAFKHTEGAMKSANLQLKPGSKADRTEKSL